MSFAFGKPLGIKDILGRDLKVGDAVFTVDIYGTYVYTRLVVIIGTTASGRLRFVAPSHCYNKAEHKKLVDITDWYVHFGCPTALLVPKETEETYPWVLEYQSHRQEEHFKAIVTKTLSPSQIGNFKLEV